MHLQRFTAFVIILFCALLQTYAQEKIVNAYGTIPQLLQLNPNTYNNVVAVQGLSTANDGQGGIFAYDGSSSTSTNTTNVFKPSAYDGRWLRVAGGGSSAFKGDGTVFSNNTQTVTGQGGLVQLALIPQTTNTVLAGPSSGAAAAPTFRALTLASGDFANQGTATTVLHGNAAGAPTFAAVSLTADVSGTLPIANGGTGGATAAAAKTALGVQFGSTTTATDGTVTNTFGTAFASAPNVVVMQTGNACTVTNALTITSSNFVFGAGAPSIAVQWIAIGAP